MEGSFLGAGVGCKRGLCILFLLGAMSVGLVGLYTEEVWGASWYVRPKAGKYGRSDGRSYAQAFDGLHRIVWGKDGVVAGDTLYICGTHQYSRLRIKASGTRELPIVITGDHASDPGIIDCWGCDISLSAGIATNGHDYIFIKRIRVMNNEDPKMGAIEIESGSIGITVSQCVITPAVGRGIRIWGGCHDCMISECVFDGNKKSGNLLHFYVASGIVLRNVRIYKNVFRDSGGRSIVAYWTVGAGLHKIQIKGNAIIGGKAGVRFVPGDNAEMAYDIDIDGNDIADTTEAAIRLEWITSGYGKSYVRNNTISQAGGAFGARNINGIRVGACVGVIIEKNDVFGVNSNSGDGNGIIVDLALIDGRLISSRAIIVRYNKSHENVTQGGAGISVYGSVDSEVYYNLCYDNLRGISVGEEEVAMPRSKRTLVFNNVMYGNRIAGGLLRSMAGASKWQNNIAYRNTRYGLFAHEKAVRPASMANCVNDNGSDFVNWIDTGGIRSAPLFREPSKGDFRLKNGSPCIDAGIEIVGKKDLRDFQESNISQFKAPNLGAYECTKISPPVGVSANNLPAKGR